jgi:hypothetical protein
MQNRVLKCGALVLSLCISGLAQAQEPEQPDAPLADAPAAKPEPEEPKEEDADKPKEVVEPKAELELAPKPVEPKAEAPPPPAVAEPPEENWQTDLYGFIEIDAIRDSTQSFTESSNNNLIFRRGTYQGNHGRAQFTAKNTRFGFKIGAPAMGSVRVHALLEADFFGQLPYDTLQNDFYVFGTLRMRQAYVKVETNILDALGGQYPDLFGWGGAGFYPNTVAFLGVPGQVYHRNPQFRLSKTVGGKTAELEIAAAAVRPAQRDAGQPDGEGGLRFALNAWQGVSAQGSGEPALVPLGLAVSGVARRYAIPDFRPVPGESQYKTAWGIAANAMLPVIPAKSAERRNNALTISGEFSSGTGIADLYTGLTGGARMPALPNPEALQIPPIYPQNIDNGLATFDSSFNAQTIQWQAFVVSLQYYLPIAGGKIWVSGTYAELQSDNIAELTPPANIGGIFIKETYFDVNLFAAPAPHLQTGLSFQSTRQGLGDGIEAKNDRGQLALLYFF